MIYCNCLMKSNFSMALDLSYTPYVVFPKPDHAQCQYLSHDVFRTHGLWSKVFGFQRKSQQTKCTFDSLSICIGIFFTMKIFRFVTWNHTYLVLPFLPLSYFDGLVQERNNSTANALELRLSCTNPSICSHHFKQFVLSVIYTFGDVLVCASAVTNVRALHQK